MSDLAQKAYEAWWDVMAGGSAAAGEAVVLAIPKFEQVEPITRQAWVAAANAVEHEISAERVP